MKRFILAIAAVAALACGCDKLSDRIDQIEDRVSALEQKCADLNTTITTVQKLVEAQAAGISIKDVKKVENGFQITFSDGTSYSIVNGAKGDAPAVTAVAVDGVYYWQVNGEWLVDGDRNKIPVTGASPQLKIEDEKWYVSTDGGKTWEELGVAGKTGVDVKVTEDDDAYYFDFGEGNVVTIAKMSVFVLKVEKDSIAVAANATETIAYTITGGDETTHLVAEGSGYTAKIDAAAKTISITAAAETAEGYVIVKAIRNSDGAASSQFIVVNASGNGGDDEDLKEGFKVEISNITGSSFDYKVVPNDPEMAYIAMASSKAYIDKYELSEDAALFQDDMDYFTELGANYSMTLAQVLEVITDKGTTENTVDELDPETDYVFYVYGVSSDAKLLTKITRVNVTTTKAEEGSSNPFEGKWTVKGTQANSSGTTDLEATITITMNEDGKTATIAGLGSYPAVAEYDSSKESLNVILGAGHSCAVKTFSGIGDKHVCWMGYDGTYVYTGGYLYLGLSDDKNSIKSNTVNTSTNVTVFGMALGLYDVNDDGSVGSWAKYSYGNKFLFESITKASATSSVKSGKKFDNNRIMSSVEVKPERCNCVERVF